MNNAWQATGARIGQGSFLAHAAAPKLGWAWLLLFVLTVALLGGSSRPDPMQNALLRPIASLVLIPALFHLRLADLRRFRTQATLLGLLLLWMLLQLVPLPPTLWQALPARGAIADLDRLAGIAGAWRPLSLAPFRGLNAVLSMVVPVTAFLLAVSMKVSSRGLLLAVAVIGVIDALFGLMQVIGGPRSPLYLFAISSRGAPAGIFANENHSAVFSAIVLLVIARLAVETRNLRQPDWIRLSLAPAFVLVFLSVLVTGSRAGFAATMVALLASGGMAFFNTRENRARTISKSQATTADKFSGLLFMAFAAGIIIVMSVFVWSERTPAVGDILQRGSFEDLRWSLWPILGAMAGEHWLAGTGIGSFDAVYRLYEPTELLLSSYVNHAHNDWAQFIIEGGLPATLLLVAILAWLCSALLQIGKRDTRSWDLVIFWIGSIGILSAASVVDYPLRTPIFQCLAVWLLITLAFDRSQAGA